MFLWRMFMKSLTLIVDVIFEKCELNNEKRAFR
jgi:hypothetical protein